MECVAVWMYSIAPYRMRIVFDFHSSGNRNKEQILYISEQHVRGMNESTRPIVIYRNRDGSFKNGFVMRADEFIASMDLLNEARTAAGLPIDEQYSNKL